MEQLYTPDNTEPAYQLNWGLTLFWRQLPIAESHWRANLQEATEPDGVRIIKHRTITGDASQFFVSTKPHVAPSELIRSVKGRLQHLIRSKAPKAFQRNYCLRSIGAANRSVVEDYVANQLNHHKMADPRVPQHLSLFQKSYPNVDLSKASFSSHGKYWCNLHLAIVNQERWMEVKDDVLNKTCCTIERVASKHGHRMSRLGLLADHIHIMLGCPIGQSPEEVALDISTICAR